MARKLEREGKIANGTIKWFGQQKGYGFGLFAGLGDVFIFRRDFRNPKEARTVSGGSQIKCRLATNAQGNGYKAVDVTLIHH
jgi:cold shock CspA family protein